MHALFRVANRHSGKGVAVIAVAKVNDALAFGLATVDPVLAGHFERHFDCDRAGISEEDALQITRQERRQA